jgi:hypothetical protein
MSQLSQPPAPEISPEELARDLYEERAAIREFCGGQDRAEAERAAWFEAQRAAGITALDDWRREAEDPHNPDNCADILSRARVPPISPAYGHMSRADCQRGCGRSETSAKQGNDQHRQ